MKEKSMFSILIHSMPLSKCLITAKSQLQERTGRHTDTLMQKIRTGMEKEEGKISNKYSKLNNVINISDGKKIIIIKNLINIFSNTS
jgi:hypothetical protein